MPREKTKQNKNKQTNKQTNKQKFEQHEAHFTSSKMYFRVKLPSIYQYSGRLVHAKSDCYRIIVEEAI